MESNQVSLFDLSGVVREKDLQAVRCKFVETYDTNFEDLFSGYDDIKVLTFSYSVSFINKILPKFKSAEIILGSEPHAKYDIKEVMAAQEDNAPFMAFQASCLRGIRRNQYLVDRVLNNEVSIYLAKDIIAHEKLYILSSDSGSSRIICGSANFSNKAFDGQAQRESILVFDDDSCAYDWAIEEFDMVRDLCTQEIIKASIYYSETGLPKDEKEEIVEIPIIAEAIAKEAGIILESNNIVSEDEYQFAVDISSIKNRLKGVVNGVAKKSETGKILVTPIKRNELIRAFKKNVAKEIETKKEFPEFNIDLINHKATFIGKEFNLNPEDESIKADIEALDKFFSGYDGFLGNVDETKKQYFLLLNYMFLTPFIGKVRNTAYRHKYASIYFPVFAVLVGDKNSGKSSFVKAIQKFMFTRNLPSYTGEHWTKTNVRAFMNTISEIPILIDDISRQRFKENADEIIKEDDNINQTGLTTIPTFILTSNDISTSIEPALKKRMLYITSDLKLDNVNAAYKHKSIYESIGNINGSFYCEYIRRMIDKVNDLLDLILADTLETEGWHPDLFKLSSETICEIVSESYGIIPEYMRQVTFEDYFGVDTAMTRDIKAEIISTYQHNRKAFAIDRKRNKLVYTPGEKSYEAKRIADALPEFLEAKVQYNYILMELDKAESFFGIKFKEGLLDKFNGWLR